MRVVGRFDLGGRGRGAAGRCGSRGVAGAVAASVSRQASSTLRAGGGVSAGGFGLAGEDLVEPPGCAALLANSISRRAMASSSARPSAEMSASATGGWMLRSWLNSALRARS